MSTSGVCYARTDDGLELPVVDVTHPAFACSPSPQHVARLERDLLRNMRTSAFMPRFMVRKMAQKSIVVRGVTAASGSYLSAQTTYLQKIAPHHLQGEPFTSLDRKMLGTLAPLSVRMRLEDIARRLAEALAPLLARSGGPLHLVNVGGGTAVDSLNTLIVLHKTDPGLLRARATTIHVLDIEPGGPAFGARALEALQQDGSALGGLDIRMVHTRHDWNDTGALGALLDTISKGEAVVACCSEGGLFEYGPDAVVRANLATLREHAAAGCVVTGSLARDNEVLRAMKRVGKLTLVLRNLDTMSRLATAEGWSCEGGSRNPMYEIVLLRKQDGAARNTEFQLGKVPETLLLPLWGRAQLTRAGSRILRDDAALELIDRLEYDFTKIRADLNYSNNVSWIARARQFDDKVKEFVAREPDATIVNLGAGLDTTFARVDNGRLQWFDLDLPEVIEIRKRLIPERQRARCIAASALDPAWMASLGATSRKLKLIAGGVLFYFTEAEVKQLLRTIGERLPGAELVFDAMTSGGVKLANRMLRRVGMETAVIQWGLTNARELESWGAGLELVEQFEYFRGLSLKGAPVAARVMAGANRWYGAMTIVHCRWSGE